MRQHPIEARRLIWNLAWCLGNEPERSDFLQAFVGVLGLLGIGLQRLKSGVVKSRALPNCEFIYCFENAFFAERNARIGRYDACCGEVALECIELDLEAFLPCAVPHVEHEKDRKAEVVELTKKQKVAL